MNLVIILLCYYLVNRVLSMLQCLNEQNAFISSVWEPNSFTSVSDRNVMDAILLDRVYLEDYFGVINLCPCSATFTLTFTLRIDII